MPDEMTRMTQLSEAYRLSGIVGEKGLEAQQAGTAFAADLSAARAALNTALTNLNTARVNARALAATLPTGWTDEQVRTAVDTLSNAGAAVKDAARMLAAMLGN